MGLSISYTFHPNSTTQTHSGQLLSNMAQSNPVSHDLLTLPTPHTLGEFIKARRTVLGLSVLELATLLGFSYSCVAHYEADARTPRLSKLKKLAKALKVDVKTLIEFMVK